MKIQLWPLLLPFSWTIFPGTPWEEIFGTSHRPLSGTEESSFHSGYGRLAPNADGQLATIPHWNLLPTSEVFPPDNAVISQHANEWYQPPNAYVPNQAEGGLGRIVSNQGKEILQADTGMRIGLTDAENGPPIVPQSWSYGQHFESYASPMQHHTNHEFVTYLPQYDDPYFSHVENPIVENPLYDRLLDKSHTNQAQLINPGETTTSEGIISAQDVPLNTGGKRKTPEPPTNFEHRDDPTWGYYNQIAKFIQDDHHEISPQSTSDRTELISKKAAIQAHSQLNENVKSSKKRTKTQKLFHKKQSIISPESVPAPDLFPFLEVVEFKPSSIDSVAMIEAIHGLKLPDGRKFVNIFFENIDAENQLMIVKNPSRIKANQLSKKYQGLYRSTEVEIRQAMQDGNTLFTSNKARYNLKRAIKLKQASQEWKIFFEPALNGEKKTRIEEYKKLVMKDIEEERKFPNIINQVQNKFFESNSDVTKRLKFLNRVERVLPAFFFYVDLITTIFPNEDLKNGDLLKTTRQNAGKIILELLKEKLLQPKLPMHSSEFTDYSFESMAARKIFARVAQRFDHHVSREVSFNWKFVYYWMLKSRKDLLEEDGAFCQPSNEFKALFNDFFTSWNSIITN